MARTRCQKSRSKRALTAYNRFLSKFMKSRCIATVKDAQKALEAGAKVWREMSCTEKRKYGKIGAHFEASSLLNHQVQFETPKAPPRPFAAFVRDYYRSGVFELKREGETGRDLIGRLSKTASAVWHQLGSNFRDQYSQDFQAQYQQHKILLAGILERSHQSQLVQVPQIRRSLIQFKTDRTTNPFFREKRLDCIQLEMSNSAQSKPEKYFESAKYGKIARRRRNNSRKYREDHPTANKDERYRGVQSGRSIGYSRAADYPPVWF